MPETTPLIKAALNLRVGAGFDVYVPSKPLPQASSSDDNNAPWEHDTTRQERDHVIIDEKLDTELDLD